MSAAANLDAPVTIDGVFAQIRAVMVERDRLRDSIERAAAALGLHDAANGDPASIIAKCRRVLGAGPGETLLEACTRAAQRQPRPAPLTPERAAVLDDAAEATARMVAAIQGQAREGEMPDQTVERIIRERDGLRKNFDGAIADLRETERERERLRTRNEQLVELLARDEGPDGDVETLRAVRQVDAELTAAAEERAQILAAIQTAIPAIRAGINALGSSEADVRSRNAARDSLHALEAAVEGQPPAAVLSAAERKAVEALRRWRELPDERIGDPFAPEWLDVLEATDAMIEAGRPLASEGKEG